MTKKNDRRERWVDARAKWFVGKWQRLGARKIDNQNGEWMLERIETSESDTVYDQETWQMREESGCRSAARLLVVAASMSEEDGQQEE